MRTSWENQREGFVLEVDHDHSIDTPEWAYHEWVTIPARYPAVYRDWLGRKTEHLGWRWDVVTCNNSACPARVLVRRGLIERLVRGRFPTYQKETP